MRSDSHDLIEAIKLNRLKAPAAIEKRRVFCKIPICERILVFKFYA